MQRSASAPSSLMICGEHAVLHGAVALVAAMQPRVQVEYRPRSDHLIFIFSDLAQHQTDIKRLETHPNLRFMMCAIQRAQPTQGFDLTVKSNIPADMGLGSSAAVTAATVALLHPHQNHAFWHREALQVVRTVQKRGSGADVAAAIYGGLSAYRQGEHRVEALSLPPHALSIRYAGYKTPTAQVLAQLAARPAAQQALDAVIYREMAHISQEALAAARLLDWTRFYHALNAYQKQMEALGVCDATQAAHVRAAQESALACKISGSGLGDCVIAFAERPPSEHQALDFAADGLLLSS